MNLSLSALLGLACCVALFQPDASFAMGQDCKARMAPDMRIRSVKSENDAVKVGQVVANEYFAPRDITSFTPRVAKKVKANIWEIYGFTPGGLGRLVMQIDIKRGCVIGAVIQP